MTGMFDAQTLALASQFQRGKQKQQKTPLDIIVLGAQGVGKSSLIQRLTEVVKPKKPNPGQLEKIEPIEDRQFEIFLKDTDASTDISEVQHQQVVLILFDPTSKKSYQYATRQVTRIRQEVPQPANCQLPILLVATKNDIKQPLEVQPNEVRLFAHLYPGVKYFGAVNIYNKASVARLRAEMKERASSFHQANEKYSNTYSYIQAVSRPRSFLSIMGKVILALALPIVVTGLVAFAWYGFVPFVSIAAINALNLLMCAGFAMLLAYNIPTFDDLTKLNTTEEKASQPIMRWSRRDTNRFDPTPAPSSRHSGVDLRSFSSAKSSMDNDDSELGAPNIRFG